MRRPTNQNPTEQPTGGDVASLAKHAEQILAAIEGLPLGDAGIDAALTRGREAIEAVHSAAMAEIFPTTLTAVPVAVLEEFKLWIESTGMLPFESLVPALVQLHADTIDTYPELAAVVRGPRGQRLARLHARRAATPEPAEWERAESAALQALVSQISKQLRDRHLFMPASAVLSEHVPQWTARLDTVARRIAEAEAERKRIAAAEAERERQRLEAMARAEESKRRAERLRGEDRVMARRREELAGFFRTYRNFKFPVNGGWRTAEECASDVEQGAEFTDYYKIQSQGRPLTAR